MNPNIIMIYYIVMVTVMLNYVNAIDFPQKGTVPALIVFGDSIVDPGNNNYVPTIGKGNYPPYGRDFPGGVATGRFSNGKIPGDLCAEELGIKEFIPPYMDPNLQTSDLLTGVSFAFGAAGFDPASAKMANVLTLDDQLNLFKEYINKLKAAVGENRTSTIISESIYLICAGSNDITNTYFLSPINRYQYNISTYTDMMINWSYSFLQELYTIGARRVGVLSAPPSGCLPTQRTLYGGLSRSCVEEQNQAATIFNTKLFSQLSSLNNKLAGSRFVFLDIYNLLMDVITKPSHSGFIVIDRGCCGTGKIETIMLCNKMVNMELTTCEDASKYLFWDSFHPTEAAYKLLVTKLLQNNIEKFF